MCRNIRQLYNYEPPATDEEIYNASLQFIRKISGFRKPSKINQEIFDESISKISTIIVELLEGLQTRAKPKNREEEARKARERVKQRYG